MIVTAAAIGWPNRFPKRAKAGNFADAIISTLPNATSRVRLQHTYFVGRGWT